MKSETKFLYLSPVLASADVSRDVKWYEDKLGFKNVYDSTMYQAGEMDYAVIGKQNLFVHLQFQYPKDMIASDIKFEVSNIDPFINDCIEKGLITSDKVQRKTPWNTCEFSILDLSGNRITFLEDL